MLWVSLVFISNLFLVTTIAVREAKRSNWALMWVAIGTVLPIIGFLVYCVLARSIHPRRPFLLLDNDSPTLSMEANTLSPTSLQIATSVQHFTNAPLTRAHVQVCANGQATFDALATAIECAKQTIYVDFYIYREDEMGKFMSNLLIQKAQNGVRVRFIHDGLGSISLSRHELQDMRLAGIECRTFYPVRFPWLRPSLNYRNHSKIVIIDGSEGFVGGINVGNEYTGIDPKIGPWRDSELHIISDNLSELQSIFNTNWNVATPVKQHRTSYPSRKSVVGLTIGSPLSSPSGSLHRCVPPWNAVLGEWGLDMSPQDGARTDTEPKNAYLQIVEGGPHREVQTIRQLFFTCITQATTAIDITTPYFAPDVDLIVALKIAVARGVHVRLLIPRTADHKLIAMASRTYYPDLIAAGVHVYFYERGILHAKVMTVDGEITIVGAANFDLRSFHLNYEVCAVVYSREVSAQATKQFEQDLKDGCLATVEELQQRPLWQRTLEQGARILAPLL